MVSEEMLYSYIYQHYDTLLTLLRDLCHIPAPSGKELARAEFCKNWLEKNLAKNVYIDEALNVIFPLHCENSNEITVLAAHTDTVFPDLEPLPYREDEENIYCPGVGDDTASLAVLMMTAKFCVEHQIVPEKGILFVCNSSEEGLGNLKGTRRLMQDYAGRIAQFITFDSNLNIMNTRCVGSHRYRVTVTTEGGHSFQQFGKPNAIAVLSNIVSQIYQIQIPQFENTRTSYNVGIIEGGTSVNTIAQNASMLCEYRSDNLKALALMQKEFEIIFQTAEADGVQIQVEKIGDRPCAGEVDITRLEQLISNCKDIITKVIPSPIILKSASTDCNIPLSLGIPAVCVGVYLGGGSHTREEWVSKKSLKQGLEIALQIALLFCDTKGCETHEKATDKFDH